MSKPTQQQIGARLHPAPLLPAPSDQPCSDLDKESDIVVTLEQLRPYDHNPRFIRNPLYEDIKSSIRERGLDQVPAITRRPGGIHFVIVSGGNTRLAILNELWKETREERYFKIACRYRPWTSETHALLGHLAESDLHGQLAFIERALAVAKVKGLLEADRPELSQRELAQALSTGGYPISQSQISRMFDAVEYLLPNLPNALCSGLSKAHIERLIDLRKRAEQLCNRQLAPTEPLIAVWAQTLSSFDTSAEEFDEDEVRGAFLGKMAQVLGLTPRWLELELTSDGARAQPSSEFHPDHGSIEQRDPLPKTGPLPGSLLAPHSTEQISPAGGEVQLARAEEPPRDETPLRLDTILDDLAVAGQEPVGPDIITAAALPGLGRLTSMIDPLPAKDLRRIACELAQALAEFADLPHFVVSSPFGLGFTLDWEGASTPSVYRVAVQLLLTAILGAQDEIERSLSPHLPRTLLGPLMVGNVHRNSWDTPNTVFEFERLPEDQLGLWIQLVAVARRLVDINQDPRQFDAESQS